jgi:putative phosphoesterase
MKAVVLADTHIRDGGATRLSDRAWHEVEGADIILHAGDITGPRFLAELRTIAPVHAVLGNNDVDLVGMLPETVDVVLEGVRLAMVHDGGQRAGREARLHRRFPDAAVVIFGHSHIPWSAPGVGEQWLFNPGSPTQRRSQPHRTLGLLHLAGGAARPELVIVD